MLFEHYQRQTQSKWILDKSSALKLEDEIVDFFAKLSYLVVKRTRVGNHPDTKTFKWKLPITLVLISIGPF